MTTISVASPSEEVILQLIAERETLRQARRFSDSDNIREQLRNMGVELYDKEKEWRCRDGRRGQLFTAGPTPCTLSDADIHERITAREEARTAKDWSKADICRDDLRQNGVEVDDRSRTWRTANGRSGTYSGTVQGSSVSVDEDEIRIMISERERARAEQDFDLADDIRKRLLEKGVELFDNDRLWKANDGRQGVIVTGGVELVNCHLDNLDIQRRVLLREEARSQKDWSTADTYRDELRTHGVELIDNEQKWRTTDGRIGSYSGSIVSSALQTQQQLAFQSLQCQQPILSHPQQWPAFVAAGGLGAGGLVGSVDAYSAYANAAAAQVFLAQQQAALQAHYASGCMPIQSLGAPPPVATVTAPVATARACGGLVAASGAPCTTSTLSNASIEALVIGRETIREGRDFASADSIRGDLRSHGVEVWDKQRAWKAADGRSGVYPILAEVAGSLTVDVSARGSKEVRRKSSNALPMSADLAAVMALAGQI